MHILLVAANSYQQRTPSAGNKEAPQTRESSTSQRQSQPTSTSHMAGAGKSHPCIYVSPLNNHQPYVLKYICPYVCLTTSLLFIVGRNAGVELRNQRVSTPTQGGAKIDHNIVFQALKELVSPRFDGTV